MVKSETVRARVTPELKHDVECVLNNLGISMSDAISLYMSQIKLNNGIPFDVRIPNKETLEAFNDVDKGSNLSRCNSSKELFEELGI